MLQRRLRRCLLAAMMLTATPAGAAVLSVTGGTDSTIPANFNPTGFPLGDLTGTPIKVFEAGDTGGLVLNKAVPVRFEFLGSEADFVNFTVNSSGQFSSELTAVGDSFASPAEPAGLVNMVFTTSGGGNFARNGGPISGNLSIAFANLGGNNWLALFDDGGAGPDFDFDDMAVKVSAVPLPGAIWLLLTAVAGLFSMTKFRRG